MNFEKITLNNLSIDGKGRYGIAAPATDFSPEKFRYIRITDINDDGSLNCKDPKSVDCVNANKYLISKNDLLIARTGASTGRSFFCDKETRNMVYAGFLIKFKIDENKANPLFIKYYFLSDKFKNWVGAFQNGATRENLNAKTLGLHEILLPPRQYQDTAASILNTLDLKIDVNNKIIRKIDKLCLLLFKENFKNSEKYSALKDIASITMGQSPSGQSLNSEGSGSVFYQGCTDFGENFPTRRLYTSSPKKFAKKGDLLLSVRAPVGAINIAKEDCSIGRGLAALNTKFPAFLKYSLKLAKPQFEVFEQEGTIFGSINKNSLSKIQIALPSNEDIDSFEKLINPYYELVDALDSENRVIKKIKDTLLPKLINGTIHLK